MREKVRQYTANFGADAAFNKFNGLTENRFAQINSTLSDGARIAQLLEDIKKRLSGGIPTLNVTSIPGP